MKVEVGLVGKRKKINQGEGESKTGSGRHKNTLHTSMKTAH